MEPLLGALAAMLAQTPPEPDPAIVTPGLLGLSLTAALGIAVYFLFRSMNRQLKRVDFPEEPAPPAGTKGDDEQQPSGP